MENEIEITEARLADLPALLTLYRHLNTSDPIIEIDDKIEAQWRSMLADANTHIVFARTGSDGRPISTCVLSIIPNLTRGGRPYALIENVVTLPDFRKRGIGTRVLLYAQELAWSANCYKVQLMTSRKEPEVLSFYVSAGFTAGEKTGFVVRAPKGV